MPLLDPLKPTESNVKYGHLFMISTSAISSATDPQIACSELKAQLDLSVMTTIIFYCASSFDLSLLADAINSHFPDNECVGCTTAGEFNGAGYETDTIVAVGFHDSCFAIQSTLIENLTEFSTFDAQKTINSLRESIAEKALACIDSNSFIFSIVDGLSAKEEVFLTNLDTFTNGIPHFGGSAGVGLDGNKTHVFYDGKFRTSAAIVMFINTKQKFSIFSVNHVDQCRSKLVVTDADARTRQVFEINGEPAASVYAELMGLSVDELDAEVFSLHPLAVKIGRDYYIRSIQRVNKAFYSLSFYCAVDKGIVLNEVSLVDINMPLLKKLESIRNSLGSPHMVMGCDCFLRRIASVSKGVIDKTHAIQSEFNLVGFNAYGEHINGLHLNQTFTGVYISEEAYE
ncbi:MAG: hypothetical protein ACJAYN_001923 [Bermanella sp.]